MPDAKLLYDALLAIRMQATAYPNATVKRILRIADAALQGRAVDA